MNSMTEMSQVEGVTSPRVTWKGRMPLVLGVSCIVTGLLLILISFHVLKSCDQCNLRIAQLCGGAASIVFLVGGVSLLLCYKRLKPSPPHLSTTEVVISEIPAEDLEKSPAALMPVDHLPRHHPVFDEISDRDISSIDSTFADDLPDYFTAVNQLKSSDTESEVSQSSDLPDYFSTTVIKSNFYVGDETTSEERVEFSATDVEGNLDSLVSRFGSIDTRL